VRAQRAGRFVRSASAASWLVVQLIASAASSELVGRCPKRGAMVATGDLPESQYTYHCKLLYPGINRGETDQKVATRSVVRVRGWEFLEPPGTPANNCKHLTHREMGKHARSPIGSTSPKPQGARLDHARSVQLITRESGSNDPEDPSRVRLDFRFTEHHGEEATKDCASGTGPKIV
jgi:hypothetical protein